MEFQLDEQQRLIKNTAEQLARDEFEADAFTWEDEFPERNQQILADQGLLGIALPEEYGGGGYSVFEVLLAQEAIGRVCPDTAHILSRSSMGPPRAIATLGNDHLKETYLPPVCSGDLVISIAISESEAGSDVANMQTTATVEGDEVIIDGAKLWVTKADAAGAFLVYAKFGERVGAIVVDKDANGLTLSQAYENMAGHFQHEITLDEVRVPVENVLVNDEAAMKKLLTEFNVERCHNAMMCVACGLNAFDKALEHAQNREQFDQPIADFQGIEWKLADMAIKLDAARLMIYRAASNAVEKSPTRLETSMAKVLANEVGNDVVDEAVQIHGAMGYMKETPVEYLYRWVRGWKIAGGTVEVQRNQIASMLKKYGFE